MSDQHQTTPRLPELTADERSIGVVISTDKHGQETRVSVNQWKPQDDEPARITLAIYVGHHRWVPVELAPEDAAKVAALILGKPAVRGLPHA